ncbi:MAG: nucleotidyltransferase [Pyrinomonadaceae bacterium]
MADSVNAAFNKFMTETVNLDGTRTRSARASREWLLDQIAFFQADATFPISFEDYDIAYGSFARRTKIRPLDDIDQMIGLHAQSSSYNTYSDRIEITVTPEGNLKPFCNEGTNTLNSIKVINKFIQKLASVPQYSAADLKRNGAAAVLSLKSYDWCFDIVPCFMTTQEFDGRTYFLIPDGKGNWMKTDPRIDRDRVTRINQAHGGNVLNVVRAIKYWQGRATMPSMNSYLIEAIVLAYYDNRTTVASKFVDVEIGPVLEYLSRAVHDFVWDPKGIQGDINDVSYDDRVKIANRAAQDHQKAAEARRLETGDDHKGSIAKWGEIFGSDFPTYG